MQTSDRPEDPTEFEWRSPRWRDEGVDQAETERDRRARNSDALSNEGAIEHREQDEEPTAPDA